MQFIFLRALLLLSLCFLDIFYCPGEEHLRGECLHFRGEGLFGFLILL